MTSFSQKLNPVRLQTAAPFHLEATVRVLQRRPSNHEVWEHDCYLRVFPTNEGHVLTVVENRGTIDAPDVRLSFPAGEPPLATQRVLTQTVERMLGVAVDPAPLHAAATRLSSLRPTAAALRGMRPPRFATLFDTFANVVPYQQLSIDAGTAIVGRLVERYGERFVHEQRTFAVFPTADAIAGARTAALIACGLSRAKAESLRNLARAVAKGELRADAVDKLSTDDALEVLCELPGIGPWSAALIMLRGFGRLDVFPPGDSGAKRSMNELFSIRSSEDLQHALQTFGAYRGYLYLCGLGARLLAKGLIRPARALAL